MHWCCSSSLGCSCSFPVFALFLLSTPPYCDGTIQQHAENSLKYEALEVDWDVGRDEPNMGEMSGGDRTKSWDFGDESTDFSLPEMDYVVGNTGRFHCIRGRRLVYVCAAMSSLSSILLGIDVGVMSGAKEYMTPDLGLSTIQEELIVGSLNVVAACGALVAGTAADFFGRRPTILLSSILFLIVIFLFYYNTLGATMMVSLFGFAQMLIGRILTGLGVGCAMMIAPVYTTEIAPPEIRGMLVSLTDVAINTGILLGFTWTEVVDAFASTDSERWRIMLGIGLVPPVFIVLCLVIMPESPRWLISKGRKGDGFNVLQRISETKNEAKELLDSISKSLEVHQEEEPTWENVLCPVNDAMRRIVTIAIALGIFQQISGTEAAVYYTPEILKQTGWNESQVLTGTIFVGVCKLGGEIIAFFLLDRVGRRSGSMALLWLCLFLTAFSIGLGPATFVVASEIVPLPARSKTMGVVICVNRLASGVIATSFVSMKDAFSLSGTFYFFACLSGLSILFYAFCVPETLGQSLEQVTEVMENMDDLGEYYGKVETNAKRDANSITRSLDGRATQIIELHPMNE